MLYKKINNYNNYIIFTSGKIYNIKNNKFIKQTKLSVGYSKVMLRNDTNRECLYIHRLLGEHFINNDNNLRCIDHIDRNPANNSLENLRWVSYSDNNKNKNMYKNNKSGYTGVQKNKNYWQAVWHVNGKKKYKFFNENLANSKEQAILYRQMKVDELYNRLI